jgi:hypothetical protein
MAGIVLKNAYVKINNVDLSDHVTQVTIKYSAEVIETTAMGSNSRTRTTGLKDWSADIEFNQDFAAGEVDATLWSLVGAAPFAVEIRPDAGSASATNPKYAGSAVLPEYNPIDGQVGALLKTKITLQGDGNLTRGTS